MNRRRFLTFCGLGIATAGGYFGWRRYHLPSIPEGMKVGTQHIEGDIFVEDSSRDSKFLEWQEESQTLITKRKEVKSGDYRRGVNQSLSQRYRLQGLISHCCSKRNAV